jgi:hypothetical protein
MHPLHMIEDFNKSRGEGFCLGGEAIVTNREFLQLRRIGIVTTEAATSRLKYHIS